MPLRRTHFVSSLILVGAMTALLPLVARAETIAAPTNLTGVVVSANQVDLTWRDNSNNEHQFSVFRRLRYAKGQQFTMIAVTPANTTYYRDSTVLPDTEYIYEVAARQMNGKKSSYSGYSNIVYVKTPPVIATVTGITLPIEVMGAAGTTVSVPVYVKENQVAPLNTLWLKIHGANYPDKISVQINNGAWMNLNNSTVNVEEPGKAYGGIGGAFASLKMTVPLRDPVAAGANTIRFRFNGTDGVSMGFRVLGFNFLNSTVGASALSANAFVDEDPNSWTPPYSDNASIAAGEKLWRSAPLINSPINKTSIKAFCADCHAQDGRDLKYFNFSNFSIVERSKFHGLTEEQGKLIASYIRTRSTTNPGRPWNPPFQPGPGLDSKPISAWSAGAGLDWALSRDLDTVNYLFPAGISKAAVATNGNLNVREIPVAMQLPDWNRWLPRIHPKDAWGAAFTSSEMLKRYNGDGTASYSGPTLRQRFADTANLSQYLGAPISKAEINTWQLRRHEFIKARTPDTTYWSPTYSEAIYSTALWQGIKMWELMHEFDMQGRGKEYFGPTAENRTWFGHISFMSSPFMLKIPSDINGIGGSALTTEYFSNAWYYIQLLVNPGNGVPNGTDPIDWGYVWGKFHDLYLETGSPDFMRLVTYFVKGTQEYDNANGLNVAAGWNPIKLPVSFFVKPAINKMWVNIPTDLKARVLDALLGAWLDKSMQFPISSYYDVGLASPSYVPDTISGYDGNFGDRLWFSIQAFRDAGVDESLTNSAAGWGSVIFPMAPWTAIAPSLTSPVLATPP